MYLALIKKRYYLNQKNHFISLSFGPKNPNGKLV
jgi:hypothetical protein